MKAQVKFLHQPLQQLKLQGLHLIEASAGTGKTWTLSSLMVRILVEKYMPRQVIATTFTRAAAAELKSRIRKRLMGMYQASLQWQQLSTVDYITYAKTLVDPLEQIIFHHFSSSAQQQNFFYLHERLKLVIDSLDELFVGTIDSFTQKLLREFSFESGEIIPRQMTENEQQYPYQIVHDVLRAWLQSQPQYIVDVLLLSRQLKTTEQYIQIVQKTLNFNQAKLQVVSCPTLDCDIVNQHLQQLIELYQQDALQQLQPYYLLDGENYKYINKKAFTKDKFHLIFTQYLPQFIQLIHQHHRFSYFDDAAQAVLKHINTLFQDSKGKPRESVFNKCPDEVSAVFYQHPLIMVLQQFHQASHVLDEQLQQLDDYLHYYLSLETKNKLPKVLLQAGETTFNQQIRSLGDALHGDTDQRLAAVIQQRYPVILVDEFQDTNQEQDNVLQVIWRHPQRLMYGCFIAVGDPKQAIYGFRGGDILTYLNAYNDIATKQGTFYRLDENFRSVTKLVEVVDALFARNTDFAEQIEYHPAKSSHIDKAKLIENNQQDATPLRLIQLNKEQKDNEEYLVAEKIRDLLAKAQQGRLYIQGSTEAQPIKIQPEDIAVLAASHYQLDKVQKSLGLFNINVNRTALTSVFTSTAAQDVAAILHAIEYPEQEAILKRALLTTLVGLTITDFAQFDRNAELLSIHVQHFRYARQIWLQRGFLIAWEYLVAQYQFWRNLAMYAGLDAERMIVNTKHLIELLSQHSYQYQGIQHLIQWYKLQLGSPMQRDWELERPLSGESGVQLMTIHKSKGLEFKIVFLLNANKKIDENKKGLAFYEEKHEDEQSPKRVIAISKAQLQDNAMALLSHQDKIAGEDHRLWYVALTRASYRIYAYLHSEDKSPSTGGIAYWLNAQQNPFMHHGLCIEEASSDKLQYQPESPDIPELYAQAYPKLQFYPKTRTSFSAIAAHVKPQYSMDNLAEIPVTNNAVDDEVDSNGLIIADEVHTALPLDWISQHFPKGTIAGNCLHEILEQLDFQHDQQWQAIFSQKISQYGLWANLKTAYATAYPSQTDDELLFRQSILKYLRQWFKHIVETPILATGFMLKDIQPEQHFVEFKFFMSLANQRFDTKRIQQLLQRYNITIPTLEQSQSARFLNGAIDLVFFDGQRYHIADYKSNMLGDDYQLYTEQNIEQSMSHASYWLQACIYLVALHRHLLATLQNYQPEMHLGGASYLYLRGMRGTSEYGVKYWKPDMQLILELDHVLGQHSSSYLSTHPVDNFV